MRMKKNKTPDDNKFDVRRLAQDSGKAKVNNNAKKAVESLNKASKSK